MRGGYRIAQGRHKLGSPNHPRENVGAKADSAPRQPRRDAPANDGSPNPERHYAPPTPIARRDSPVARRAAEPQSCPPFASLRLGARKTALRRAPPARRADRRQTRTGRAKPQSRKELSTSAGVGDFQAVGIGAGRPAHPCVATHVRDAPDLSAALRLCARQTTLPRPLPARRADRRQTQTGRAEPQSRRALTSSAGVGDTQTVRIGAGRPAPRRHTRQRHPSALGGLARPSPRRDEARRPHRHRAAQSSAPPRPARRPPQPRPPPAPPEAPAGPQTPGDPANE